MPAIPSADALLRETSQAPAALLAVTLIRSTIDRPCPGFCQISGLPGQKGRSVQELKLLVRRPAPSSRPGKRAASLSSGIVTGPSLSKLRKSVVAARATSGPALEYARVGDKPSLLLFKVGDPWILDAPHLFWIVRRVGQEGRCGVYAPVRNSVSAAGGRKVRQAAAVFEVKMIGDSFMVAFQSARRALLCARHTSGCTSWRRRSPRRAAYCARPRVPATSARTTFGEHRGRRAPGWPPLSVRSPARRRIRPPRPARFPRRRLPEVRGRPRAPVECSPHERNRRQLRGL